MTSERLSPPVTTVGALGWLRQNLFSSVISSIVTIVLGVLLVLAALAIADWVLNEARWGVITANLRLFLMGTFPFDQAWRIWLSLALLSVLTGLSAAAYRGLAIRTLANWLAAGQLLLALLALISDMGIVITLALAANAALLWGVFAIGLRVPLPRRLLALAWLLLIIVTFILLRGIGGALPVVSTNLWGGLLLTFLLAIAGIVLSFPLGVLLALGRRSDMRGVRALSTIYIEVVRGVPLITILFMAAIMLPLFLPGGLRIEQVFRAMVGITLFSAAYVAENVRGGLQAIPSGQMEAAHAIGLNTIQTNLFIVLPQALRSVIPANVGLFISLLKDTTLVAIAGTGLLELYGIGQAVLAQPQWLGTRLEVLVFISAVFFVLCYTMSQASYRLEEAMGVGKR
jgi:general L-amino acid transport system permease protein